MITLSQMCFISVLVAAIVSMIFLCGQHIIKKSKESRPNEQEVLIPSENKMRFCCIFINEESYNVYRRIAKNANISTEIFISEFLDNQATAYKQEKSNKEKK